jgi:CubicO group peptidase (beta-lactamase class C family)
LIPIDQARLGGPFLCEFSRTSARIALAAILLVASSAAVLGQPKGVDVKPKTNTRLDQPAQDALGRFSAFFKERSSAHGIVGASLRVVGPAGALNHSEFGLKDRATTAPTDEATIYHWASITKTMTGIAIMQLRDRKRLSLDDPILKYVPELEAVHNPFGPMSGITIRQLLSHSGGFRAGTWPFGGDKAWHPFEPPGWSQLVAMMPYTAVEFAPGSKYSYSNPGLVYLGRVIEKISGGPWEQYIQKNILSPLGMTRAFFDQAPYHLLKDRSHSYMASKGKVEEQPFDFDTGITVSNGGLNAPLGDMEKYVRFLLGHAETTDGGAVLSRSSLEEMWTPVVLVETNGPDTQGGDRTDMGLCFFIEKRGSRRLIGHSGSQNGFISHLYLDPAADAGYLVSFNTEATDDVPVPNTRKLDAEVRAYFVANVAPVLEAAAAAPPPPPAKRR